MQTHQAAGIYGFMPLLLLTTLLTTIWLSIKMHNYEKKKQELYKRLYTDNGYNLLFYLLWLLPHLPEAQPWPLSLLLRKESLSSWELATTLKGEDGQRWVALILPIPIRVCCSDHGRSQSKVKKWLWSRKSGLTAHLP